MAIMNIPYNPQTDPNAFAARGMGNFLGGVAQNQQRGMISDFAQGMDPQATGMQIIQDALRSGLPPQIAMGLGNIQSRNMPGVGVLPGWWSQASPQQQQNYVGRQTATQQSGSVPAFLRGDTEEETKANLKRYREKYFEDTEDIPLSPSATEAYGEAMDTRIDKVRPKVFQKGFMNLPEDKLFKEWQKYTGMYNFRNDSQRRAILNIWKNKITNEGKEESNVDWADPKWEEAIGLKPGLKTGR